MQRRTQSRKWLVAIFGVSILSVANTLFLTGDVQTFAYVVLAMGFAFFTITMSNQNNEEDQG